MWAGGAQAGERGKKNKEGTQLLSGVEAEAEEAEEAEVIIGRAQPEAETSRRGQSGHDPERKGRRGAAS